MIYMLLNKNYRAAIITASDKGFMGEREDVSGAVLKEILELKGFAIVSYCVLPDDKDQLAAEMIRLADQNLCEVIFTTGGTGLSPRDVTPEATLSVAQRIVPGISEAMRALSLTVTKRAMLSRGMSVVRGRTLIINLPGSPKAVKESLGFIIDELSHGIAILRSDAGECAR
jgi:molybdopterin adenylyltransferase